MVWQLLLKGFSISEQDSCGNNALHLAAAGGRSDVVKILMSQGVDLSIQNWYGNDAVTLATAASTKQILEKAKGQIRCVATNFGKPRTHASASGCDVLLPLCSSLWTGATTIPLLLLRSMLQ